MQWERPLACVYHTPLPRKEIKDFNSSWKNIPWYFSVWGEGQNSWAKQKDITVADAEWDTRKWYQQVHKLITEFIGWSSKT